MIDKNKIGVALSGGGYRAAAFHLGVLKKLHQLGILEKVFSFSTISGGSIAGAYYVMHKDHFQEFETKFTACLQQSVIRQILFSWPMLIALALYLAAILTTIVAVFEHWTWLAVAMPVAIVASFALFQFKIFPLSKLKEKAYRKIFFGNQKLNALPDSPKIAINSANLETGTLFTFSKTKVSDSSYLHPHDGGDEIKFNPNSFNISFAVACSTAVPVPFNPFRLSAQNYQNPSDATRISPALSDGGLYDNQGIHKLTQEKSSYECDIIICSDGSQPFNPQFSGRNSFAVLYRSMDIMMRRIKTLQFVQDVYSKNKSIAYFSLDWEYEKCVAAFVAAIKDNKIPDNLIEHFSLSETMKEEIKKGQFDNAIDYIKTRINYPKLIANGVTKEEYLQINKIATSLSALSTQEIDLLSRHSSTLVEIQISLYCPMIL